MCITNLPDLGPIVLQCQGTLPNLSAPPFKAMTLSQLPYKTSSNRAQKRPARLTETATKHYILLLWAQFNNTLRPLVVFF